MNREFLKKFEGLSDEAIEQIIIENGKDIQREQADVSKLKNEIKEAKATIQTLTTEADTLRANNANTEEWKAKFEALQADIAERERTAKEEAAKAEKEANILARYNAVSVGKDGKALEWSHDAIKTAYFQKFADALSDEANIGKSDADIFHALTKDDPVAFKGIQPTVKLKGANSLGGAAEPTSLLGALQEQYAK